MKKISIKVKAEELKAKMNLRDGLDGKDYILTEKDKKEIAKSIKVPIVEKIIEKTEVIKEQPIITNEIKEVAITDDRQQIVEKINTGKDNDLKIGATQIDGIDKFATTDTLNRAISILDQRTQFLINKPSSSYTLPTASASVLGGIKVGTRLSIDGSGVISADLQVSDTAYGASWNGDTTTAPSKNAVYDKIETIAGGSPGGSDTQVQFNDGGVFGGDAGFTYNKTTNIATIGGLFTPAITGGTGFAENLTLNTTSDGTKGTYYFPDLGVAPGFLKSSGSAGAISIDTNTYLTTNQTITLSGDATGSGTTSIVVTIDHGGLNGLSDDDHTQYAYLIGRSGGQTLFGGADAGDDLTFRTTNNITIGSYIFADITTDGYAKLGGGAGVLSAQAVPIPIADGGTNSTTALNNSRVMTAVGGAIVESGAITDGEGIQRNNTTFISAPLPLNTVEGRLTLTSGTPVTTADVSGATTVYFTPYKGDRIYLYDGTRWKLYSFSELSLALGTVTSGLPYDVFIYDNAGTLTLEKLAWTNGTTRATALTTQNGVLVKTGATTRRYLGTFYTTSTTATEDSGSKRFVWNYYNRKLRTGRIIETGDHTYATAVWREYGGGTYRLQGIWGVAETGASFSLRMQVSCGTANKYNFMGIGENTVTGATTQMAIPIVSTSVSNTKLTNYMTTPALGFNYYSVVENALSAVTITSEEMELTAMWES